MNKNALSDLLLTVRNYDGIKHKHDIHQLTDLMPTLPPGSYPNGDDTAAIACDDGYNLFAMEGFIQRFVEQDPWFAGWCGVMVNVSDIAAMGGRPTAVINALWDKGDDNARMIMAGIRDACETFNVPLVGGHTNLRAEQTMLSMAIMGHAKTLLSSFAAKPGQVLVAAIDLRGSFRAPFLNWNAATDASPSQLQGDINLLPTIAEQGLAYAAKDISQAGLLGTTVMLLESSGVGAEINLEAIPKPAEVNWSDWLCCFPSFGYLLTTDKEKLPALLELFEQRNIAAAGIGHLFKQPALNVRYGQHNELFWDLNNNPLMGLKNTTDKNISGATVAQPHPTSFKKEPVNHLSEVSKCLN